MTPYLHLDIPFNIKLDWKKTIKNLDIPQNILDHGCKLLEDETRNFLSSFNINLLSSANYWSWKYLPGSIYNYYHIDYPIDKPNNGNHQHVALNFLLDGDAGETQWVDFDKCVKINTKVNSIYGAPETNFISKKEPDYTTSLIPKKVMLTRVDLPHRVSRATQINTRWTYRIMLLKDDHFLTWDEASLMFSKYSIS